MQLQFNLTQQSAQPIEPGYCQCGCGQKTAIARYNNSTRGHIKGEPMPFFNKHSGKGQSRRNLIGAENHSFKNGTHVTHGYVILSSKIWGENRGRYEHRVVMEGVLGRPLKTHEDVHHKNGNTLDNRPENLQVMTRQDHNRTHGGGKLLTCEKCQTQKWYSPSSAARLSQNKPYRCRPCSATNDYEITCKRCGNTFTAGRTALYCANCTQKTRGRR